MSTPFCKKEQKILRHFLYARQTPAGNKLRRPRFSGKKKTGAVAKQYACVAAPYTAKQNAAYSASGVLLRYRQKRTVCPPVSTGSETASQTKRSSSSRLGKKVSAPPSASTFVTSTSLH